MNFYLKVKTDSDDIPLKPVVITDCGDIQVTSPYYVSDNPYEYVLFLVKILICIFVKGKN